MWEECGKHWNVPNFGEKPQQVSKSPEQEWWGQKLKQYFYQIMNLRMQWARPKPGQAVTSFKSQLSNSLGSSEHHFGPSAQEKKGQNPSSPSHFFMKCPLWECQSLAEQARTMLLTGTAPALPAKGEAPEKELGHSCCWNMWIPTKSDTSGQPVLVYSTGKLPEKKRVWEPPQATGN